MFRGRPRRGGAFPWDFHPHGPPSGPVAGLRGPISGRSPQGHVHPLHRESYLEDRNRERLGYHHGYHTDSEKLRRSPPRGRLPSPGVRSTWGPGGGPSSSEPFVKRLTPSPSRGGPSTDHKLAITVGNDRTGLPAWKSGHPYDRDYHYKGQHSYPPPPEKRTSYDGRYDDLAYRRRSPGRRRSRSRGRNRSRSPGRGRSKSRPPSRSRSRGRSRPRSHSRGRSWGRSRSRPRSRSPSRAKSHTRGRSRSCSGSSSRSSSSSSSSSSSGSRRPRASPSKDKHSEEFRELELARRRKEVEEMLAMPKKSILKKRVDSETDSPAILQGSDSPGEGGVEHQGSSLSRETERFLHTIAKGMESGLLASILQEWKEETGLGSSLKQHEENIPGVKQETWMENACDSLLPHEKVGQDVGGFSRILGLMGDSGGQQDRKKSFTDIEDEERFLYGDNEESQPPETDAPRRQYSQHGDMGMLQYSSDNPEFMQQYLSQDPAVFSPCRWDRAAVEDHLDTHSIRGYHDQNSMDMKYGRHSQPVTTLKKEGKAGPELNSFPPGVGPEEAKERQDVEEYEKIQELLKTIGLDLGLAEISKMAARTQERLHGNVETRPGRRTSCGSWDRSRHRSRSGSQSQSRSRSPSWSHRHGRSTNERSPSPPRIQSTSCDDAPVVPGSLEAESRAGERSWGIPVLGMSTSQQPVPLNQPPLCPPSVPQAMGSLTVIPPPSVPATYTQNPPSNYPPPAPSYPPPGYGQYGNYMPYMPPSWPMYPPPSLEPPAAPVGVQKTSAPPGRSNLRVIETVSIETQKNKPVAQKEHSSFQGLSREEDPQVARPKSQVTEEKDTNRQKQKVIEERDKLKKEREILMDKKDYLLKELERLRKQQGKLLRKKRREKDGHKDPLLAEVSRLQEEIMVQISQLRKEQEEAEKKCVELDKVALILGLHIMDKPRKESRLSGELQSSSEGDRDCARSSNNPAVGPSCDAASSKASSAPKSTPGKAKAQSPGHSPPPPASVPDQYEYYDAGDHWCKNCNTVSGSLFDFFVHLHSKSHRKTQDPYDRPWASASSKSHGRKTSAERIVKPAKGSEFLIPMAGFYCQLCKEFFGDQISAEDHVTSQTHNEKYKRHTDDFPLYEQRRNLDRQAGLAVVTDSREQRHSGVKRKLEERGERPQSLKDEKLDACHMEADREDKAGSQWKEKEEKKQDAGEHVLVKGKKGEAIKPAEPPQRTPEIQRVISGPSPSILAKVRKRSSSSSTPLAFGKFSWKRTDKENEEEKAVECAMEQDSGGDTGGDKSEARGALNKAKTIAIKLSGKTVIPPSSPWVPTSFSPTASVKIRPNLPVPAMVLRKSLPGASSKPGSQHTVKPGSVVQDQIKEKAVVTPDLISKAFCGEEVVLKTPDTDEKATTPEEIPVASTPINTAPSDPKEGLVEQQAPKEGLVEQQALSSPATCVMTLESDVAAPGVPESEQMLTIVVRPPPLLNSSDTQPKIDKPKSSLAAAKAQDLYDIFYRSNKVASDPRPGPRDLKNGEALKSKVLGSLAVRAENRDAQIVPSSTSDSYQKVNEQTSESLGQGTCPLQDADVGTKTVNADLNSGDN